MHDQQPFTVCGIWMSSEDVFYCRRFGAWKKVSTNGIAGVIAGYLGGGGYTYEQFYAELSGNKLTSLRMWDRDYITDEEIKFEELDDSIQNVCIEAVAKELWGWCSLEQFDEYGSLWLRADRVAEVRRVGKVEFVDNRDEDEDESPLEILILNEKCMRFASEISGYLGI